MSRWRKAAQNLAAELERQFDSRRLRFEPSPGKRIIVPYRGFGRPEELLVSGRVLEEKLITRATEAEPVWRNLLNAYRRFESDEVAGARVRATFGRLTAEAVTDEEGHFQLRIAPEELDSAARWHEVLLQLEGEETRYPAHVMVPPSHAEMMVISDIDDTIVQTGATSLWTMMETTFLRNAAMRVPFEGVSNFYAALIRDRNPIFYVSSSPWNLYELLSDFLKINDIPHGPMLLQDFGIGDEKLIHAPHDVHKVEKIRLVLDYYPDLPAVLIGDSGQRDPEIYLQIIQAYPARIRAAFIRDVTPDVRDQAVARIIGQAAEAGVEMLYVPDSASALDHARRIGLI
ncbi:MAG TPA: phosphatase domain-containing protein [Thermoanaerobaculia bacterium]|nr:phosphatase domain-containing protein [Thermoanaerobaculia bacterium]